MDSTNKISADQSDNPGEERTKFVQESTSF
jgi:hypothetical protein